MPSRRTERAGRFDRVRTSVEPMKRIATFVLTVGLLAACKGDGTGPSGPVEQVVMQFCDEFRPPWFAIQNEGEQWKQISVPATGPVTFDATEKVSIAFSFPLFGAITQVMNVRRDEITGGQTGIFG